MQSPAPRIAQPAASAPACLAAERRRHRRVEITLLGRIMRATRQEYPAKLIDISVGGAAMMSAAAVEIGERIVAYFDHLGGIEGPVVRTFDGGFAMTIAASRHKREKLAAQLTWLINRDELPESFGRRHERYTLESCTATLRIDAETPAEAHVRDVSISGALLETEARPALGSEVMLGKLRCRVVRHHAKGIAVEFKDVQGSESLRRHFGRGHA
ncbi:MAG TPA: PilZ domain-containing protein [Hyphomicrobiaceae bacterium]|nr:PilZ domain-containing protein [Hyphomicrobiaceae bacterium]